MSIRIAVLICIFILSTVGANAQNNVIDIAKIRTYDTIVNKLYYFIDFEKKHSIADIRLTDFTSIPRKSLFNARYPGGNYFAQLTLTNSGDADTIFYYAGKGQDYKVYEYDTSSGNKILLNNHIRYYAHAVFNKVPYSFLAIEKGKRKIIFIQFDISFYNWNMFDPSLVKSNALDFFVFDHILLPNLIYISIALFLLGIMFSMFANTFAFFVRTPVREYLYYSIAVFVFLIYFSMRILDTFSFGRSYQWFFEVRFETLQLIGAIFILMFVSSFLKFKKEHPSAYKAVKWMAWSQALFLLINIPFVYTNIYNFPASVAFDIMRLVVLLFSMILAGFVIIKKHDKESQYLGIGSIISLSMSMLALYIGRKINNENIMIRYNKVPSLIFMFGILTQMLLFLQALAYRRRMQEAERIRAVEQLQIENDRKELETYKAIIETRDNERTRISQEIHDDIGSGLTSIRLLSEIAKVKNGEAGRKELEKISATSNILMEKMNEIIWTLNSRNDRLLNLIAYLRHQIVEFFEPSNITLEINIPENIDDAPLSGSARRNIILSVKEVLHNIVKHSYATTVNVNFSFREVFIISIKDNGVGFITSHTTNYNGNGLRNIQERLKAIGGSCEIISNEGIHVLLKVPLDKYPV
ncbi:MAG: 7TM diverse intracellular signaling domain-containing protein [Agriterribacter sp.]